MQYGSASSKIIFNCDFILDWGLLVMNFLELSEERREALRRELEEKYQAFAARGLQLDMSRGKPSAKQLDLTNDLLVSVSQEAGVKCRNGVDCRNYGLLEGLPEMREIFAELLEVEPDEVLAGGNSSLNLMFDFMAQCMYHGIGGQPAWMTQGRVKMLCPCPGYDRHFAVSEYLGMELVCVPMTPQGPDMDRVEELVKDPLVKGMWNVPKYSNPDGYTYSDDTVRRIACLKPAAPDFRVIWDNAYCIHDLSDTPDRLLPIMKECKKAGNPDLVMLFASTSKITFPGAGVAAVAGSKTNLAEIKARLSMQTICPDKINQLRHIHKFKNAQGMVDHMKAHASLLRPKFDVVLKTLEQELGGTGIARWTKPNGGYFISFYALPGCAARTVALCKEAGVVMTPAGATFPYGKDPKDSNIRIAPTFPPLHELETAMELFCIAAQLAALEHLAR